MLAHKQSVSLITYNIHKGFGPGRLRFLLPEMREALAALNPDVVFLQEVQGAHLRREARVSGWPDAPQFAYLAENLWPHFAYGRNASYRSGHHGNAILSKFPMSTPSNLVLSTVRRASRGVLHCVLETDFARVHLLCVHLGVFRAERERQTDILQQAMDTLVPAGEPLLMAGDFNDWRNTLSSEFFESHGLREAFQEVHGAHARSFPAVRPALQVDRIYYRGVSVSDVHCLAGKPWSRLSDHVPLFARFTLATTAPVAGTVVP
ncbi:endonuclease/exonuclease/phosphatase family protein [Legionella geestiana]|uniref:Endonuclease/exonuclease/phosphatase family protein n=1 Tax=Legionella geestiana TaxID=45065 RepID=A0A0W0TRG2_9GAMM|nr:endonuclease/exonuclease/phosphatase family protein [Legionella geestiana]KTC98307.1 endonuclease/exonuclease/phosphatase family protein [Legionella geestiana]STX53333.1 endonuclease/exonuclease/phosphatase family protein [Legionella geestiana]